MRGNVNTLPKWAKQEIERLSQDLEYNKDKLRAGPEDSDTFADPYSDAPQPLGKGTVIKFVGANVEYRVRLDEQGLLDVNGSTSLAVCPRASNSVEIQVRDR